MKPRIPGASALGVCQLLQYIGSGGQIAALTAGQTIPLLNAKTERSWHGLSDEALNAALFGADDAPRTPSAAAAMVTPLAAPLADPEEVEPVMKGYFAEMEPEVEADNLPAGGAGEQTAETAVGLKEQAMKVRTKADFCTLLKVWDQAGIWADETAVQKAYDYVCGRWNLTTRTLAWEAMASYANQVADGAGKKAAAEAAKNWVTKARQAQASKN